MFIPDSRVFKFDSSVFFLATQKSVYIDSYGKLPKAENNWDSDELN